MRREALWFGETRQRERVDLVRLRWRLSHSLGKGAAGGGLGRGQCHGEIGGFAPPGRGTFTK